MKRKIDTLGRERVYDGFFQIDAWHLRQEAEGRTFDFTRLNLDRGDSAAILLHDPVRDTVLCVEEFRIGMLAAGFEGEALFSLGPIAGVVDAGESPREAAIREAGEEAGIAVRSEDILAEFTTLPSPGGCSEKVTMLLARADLSGVEDAVFGMAGEAEQTWRRVLPRAEVLARVENEPVSGHLTALMLKLEILRLQGVDFNPQTHSNCQL